GQRSLGELARLYLPHDFIPREVEDRVEYLLAFLGAGLAEQEKHAGAVLEVARRQQLALQKVHDERRFAAVEAAGVAATVELRKEVGRPFVVIIPNFLEQLF